ncbi:MAG: hypothetical protein KDD33_04080 [Bdellovibrionales bacterium]|nr:hypothetical protein [Bdellovibrionales bacterium]
MDSFAMSNINFSASDVLSAPSRSVASETTRNGQRRKTQRRTSRACPFGVGPMRHNKCKSSEKNRIITQLLGSRAADCYSKLFVAESGSSCSPSLYHDPKKAKNPHVGFGICAIEKSKRIRQRNGRGKNCLAGDITTSFSRQVLCCRDILEKTNARYFGTIKCGKTPNCKGLARRGGSVADAGAGGNDSPGGAPDSSDRYCKVGRVLWAARNCGNRPTNYCKVNGIYTSQCGAVAKDDNKDNSSPANPASGPRFCKVGNVLWHSSHCGSRPTNYCKVRGRYTKNCGDVASNQGAGDRQNASTQDRYCKVGKYLWPAKDCGNRSTNYCKIDNRYTTSCNG